MGTRTSTPSQRGSSGARGQAQGTAPTGLRSDRYVGAALSREQRPRKQSLRWKLLLMLLVGALIVSIVLVTANVLRGTTTLTVQVAGQPAVSIDLNQSVALSPYLRGSNVFPETGTSAKDPTGQGFMSYSSQVILGLRSAGIRLLRFPGGNWGEEHTPSTEQLNDFSNLLNQVGAEGFMQVQLSDPLDKTPVPLETRATRAALLVDYMNNSKSIQRMGANANAPFHPVQFWSIGNEPDLLINPDTGEKYTVQEYTQTFIMYSLAMHEKDPNIKVFGPEISAYSAAGGPKDRDGNLWMAGFLNGISQYERTHNLPFHLLDGVSFHYYPFGLRQTDANTLLNNPTQWNLILPPLHQLIERDFGEDLPVAITEINTNSGMTVEPQNLTATWWAETLGELMNNQVDYVAYFSTEGVDNPYPLFTKNGLVATSMLRTMQLFAQLQNNLVPVQNTQGPISVYATQDGGHNTVSLLFINKTNQSQHINVRDDSVLPIGLWQSASVTLPAYGMAVLTLHRTADNEIFSFTNA